MPINSLIRNLINNMKARLPKTLLAALLAAMAVGTTEAGYYTIGGVIGVDENGNSISGSIKPTDIPGRVSNAYAPIVKDGTGTLTIDTAGHIANDLFVREGELIVKGNISVSSQPNGESLHPRRDAEGNILTASWGVVRDGHVGLSVSGKDASMVIDGAEAEFAVWGVAINVGGTNGNGKLLLKNGAKINTNWGYSTFIGYKGYLDIDNINLLGWTNGHATTATTNGSDQVIADRYVGNYTPGSQDDSKLFGHGEVIVSENSHFNLGDLGGLYMAEGTLTIEKSSSAKVGNGTHCAIMGIHEGSTSVINLTEKSKLLLNTWDLRTCELDSEPAGVNNSKAIINVDDSELESTRATRLSASSDSVSTTVMNLTNGAKALLGETTVGSESDKSTATINIDAASALKAYCGDAARNLTINHGSVNNAGTIAAGTVDVNKGGNLTMIGDAAKLEAECVNVGDGGTLSVASGSDATISSDVEVGAGGSIVLNNGNMLNVTGALTLGKGSSILLNGGYESGDVFAVATDGLVMDGAEVKTADGKVSYTLMNGNQLQLTGVFRQSVADVSVQANWGAATASRAFVNTVRGQRTNTGCIANGRGTAWVSILGATHDIAGGDINQRGAAVGADLKVGKKCNLGVAFGYVDGDVKPNGLRSANQSGTYMAFYGEHSLKKLTATSCLNLDWVAAYGRMETKWNGIDWNQDSLQVNTRLSWNNKVTDRLSWNAFAGLEYYTNESDTAEGIKSGSIQNLRGELGVGVSYVAWGSPDAAPALEEKGGLVKGCKQLVLHGELRYIHDMVRSNPVVEMDNMRGGSANPGRQGLGIEAGATYRFNERWSSSVNYGYNAMDDSREHRVNVGASYTF